MIDVDSRHGSPANKEGARESEDKGESTEKLIRSLMGI